MTKIAFIGLGHMGQPMVKNLLEAGFTAKVFDLSVSAMQALAAKGALMATSLADAAMDADIIITMLQTGEQVRQVCLGATGLFAHAKPGVLYIDSSSIDMTVTRELHEASAQMGIAMLDAPVSGGVVGAEARTLTFMVGGDDESFSRAEPILRHLGKKIVHTGMSGSGQAAKICNNLMLGIQMIAVCEGFSLAQKLGLEAKKLFEVSSNASAQCWSMTSYCPVPGLVEKAPSNQDYQPGFTANMMLKDLRLAQRAAESVNATIPLGAEATQLYSLFVNQGHGEMDFSGIIKSLEASS